MKSSVHIKRLQEKIDSLSLRERGFLLLTLSVVILLGWQGLLIDPISDYQAQMQSEYRTIENRIVTVNAQSEAIIRGVAVEEESDEQKKITRLDTELQQVEQEINRYINNTVSPQQMVYLLEELLSDNSKLEVVSVQSNVAVPVIENNVKENEQAADNDNRVVVYKHGMTISLRGTYSDVLKFLRTAEGMNWAIFWDSIVIEGKSYPDNYTEITVHTISLENEWIGV